MKRALITGGAGFVGRRFTKRLLRLGYHVDIVDNCSTGLPPEQWLVYHHEGSSTFYHNDIRQWMRKASSEGYDTIFHLAAVIGGRLKIDGDPLSVATDLSIDADFFGWLARNANNTHGKIVYFSSSAVYPVMMQTENFHIALGESLTNFTSARLGRPDNTYGWAKLTGEYLAGIAAKQYGLNVVFYRPFSGYGEDQDMTYPFPSVVKRVFAGENPVTVWGSGRQSRDFIHIEDVVDAVLATMDKLKPGEVLNLGSGSGTTFTDLAKLTASILGRPITVENDASKPEGVFYRVADTWKMEQWYKPTTTLEQGVRKMLDKLKAEL